jgi:hypothetical protein
MGMQVYLNPPAELPDMPIKSFYRYSLPDTSGEPQPSPFHLQVAAQIFSPLPPRANPADTQNVSLRVWPRLNLGVLTSPTPTMPQAWNLQFERQ